MNNYDDRLALLVKGADETGFTVDYLEFLTRGLSKSAVLKVIGNASSMPQNMKSSDNPYTRRISRAPVSDSLVEPVSQFE